MGFDWEQKKMSDGQPGMFQVPCKSCQKLRATLKDIDRLFYHVLQESATGKYFYDQMSDELYNEWSLIQQKLT
jgi:hypothetical protein